MAMEFGLFYEIPVPRPWTAQRARRATTTSSRRRCAASRWGSRTSGPSSTTSSTSSRTARRPRCSTAPIAAQHERIKIGHGVRLLPFPYNHPMRVAEMAAALDIVSRRAAGVRHRPVVDARRARGLRHRSATTRAACGRRRSTSSSAPGRTTSSSGAAATSRCRRAACTRSRSSSRIRRSGWRRPTPTATSRRPHAGSACCRSPSACRRRSSAARIRLYRDGLEGGEAGRQVRQPARRDLHHGALRGDQRRGARERRGVGRVVLPHEHRADRHVCRLAGERQRELGTYAYAQALRDLNVARHLRRCSTRWAR